MAAAPMSQLSLLIVDDEPDLRELVSMNAEGLGFDVIEVADGSAALEIIKERPVDIVVSDLMMPRMGGLDLLERLQSRALQAPFIILSAYASDEYTIRALRLGAFDLIEKPFDSDALKEALQRARDAVLAQRQVMGDREALTAHGDQEVRELEAAILTLRTLTYRGELASEDIDPTGPDAHELELFCSEIQPQLTFSQASIDHLIGCEDPAREMTYLLRVMQAVRFTAQAVGLDHVAALAGDAEVVYTVLRMKPQWLDQETWEVLHQVHEELRSTVDTMPATKPVPPDLVSALAGLRGSLQDRAGLAA